MTVACLAPDVDPRDLQAVDVLGGLGREGLEVLAEWLEVEQVGERFHLGRQGAAGFALVILRSGTASVSRAGVEVRRIGPGDWFGDASADWAQGAPATVTTDTPAIVYQLCRSSLRQMDRAAPTVAAALRTAIATWDVGRRD